MIVFKTYFKILKKNLFIVLIYSFFLIFFTGFNLKTSDNNINYIDTKPDILIINEDESRIANHMINYLESNTNHVKIKNNENSINDAIFYRDVSYIIYIPKNYQDDLLNNLNPEIKIKSTDDYEANLANLYLEKYLKTINIFKDEYQDINILLDKTDLVLKEDLDINVTKKIDTSSINQAVTYYNFLNYSMLASSLYIISIMLLSFNGEKVKKRITVSSMKQSKLNKLLFLANSSFILSLWIIYVLLSFTLVGKIMFTASGLLLIINSFIFSILCQIVAIFISNLLNNKDSINGITNVVSLGTSFLCGAFVPVSFLPDVVVKVSRILPSYWFINTNEIIKTLDIINKDSLKPIIINMIVLIIYIIVFIIINNYLTKLKRKKYN